MEQGKRISTKELRPKQDELLNLQKQAIDKLESLQATGSLPRKCGAYEESLSYTLVNGKPKFDRTGTDTVGIHGYQSRFNLDNGFPLITTKKVHLESIIHELIWLISGKTNIQYLVKNGVTIWDDWPFKNWWQSQSQNSGKQFPKKGSIQWDEMGMKDLLKEFRNNILNDIEFCYKWGDLGPVYGKQWREWSAHEFIPGQFFEGGPNEEDVTIPSSWKHRTIDQIQQVVSDINKQHETGVISRRMIVSAWNVGDIPAMIKSGLPPCHCLFQFHSTLMTLDERLAHWAKKNEKDISYIKDMDDDDLDAVGAPIYQLDLQLYQRSCDIFLGVPFNIASYALLLMMVAQVTNCKPRDFIHDYGDLHIYSNHLDQVVEQLSREPYQYPVMKINPDVMDINSFKYEDFTLSGYQCHSAIKGAVAV